MDREQVIYRLKAAIEMGKLPEFEVECNDEIQQLNDYIRVS